MIDQTLAPRVGRRRFFAPEVVQTSAMDCGPAALKSLLEGCGVPISYGRLREACRTDIDGTSIDTLEALAGSLGLSAEQILIPRDHLLLPEAAALPAIAVFDSPMGGAHFVVIWRRLGRFVQVMDPSRGRVWLSADTVRQSLYQHTALVSANEWRAWAESTDFLAPLDKRLGALGLPRSERQRLVDEALAQPGWQGLAAVDAAVRLVASLKESGSLERGNLQTTLARLIEQSIQAPVQSVIPEVFWSVRPAPPDSQDLERLAVSGAVLVRVHPAGRAASDGRTASSLPPEIRAAVSEPRQQPLAHALRLMRSDGLLGPGVVAAALIIAAGGVLLEAILLRSLLEVGRYLQTAEQALVAGLSLATFALLMLALEFGLGAAEQRAGRRLETRLRIAFLDKIPRLTDAYFQSRPISDMAERGHGIHTLRTLPGLAFRLLRLTLELIVTTLAIAWLAPEIAWLALLSAVVAAALPMLGHGLLAERDLKVKTHAGALGRFHLDALLGRTAIEAHGAAPAIAREHELLLREWVSSALALQRGSMFVEALQMLIGFSLAGWIIFSTTDSGVGGATLLLVYWVLNLPALGYELSLYAREYPAHRSTLLRLLEPLGAQEDESAAASVSKRPQEAVEIAAANLSVNVAGHQVLEDINLRVEPGSHVAIVGPSGAGKSTLVGLLLGWHRPSEGTLLIDGHSVSAIDLETLRTETAWVDPSVRLWNRSLLENLQYGSESTTPVGSVLDAAGLLPVVAKLPDGLATPLGEGGGLLSAGEAQRVRLARAMLKPSPRLVLLDEPFMGLERDRRRAMLTDIRQRWAGSTLLYVTHDISEARSFERVIVVERGRIVEEGDPRLLTLMASSRYRRLLQAQEAVQARLNQGSEWRRVRVQDGQVVQDVGSGSIEQTA